MIARVGNHFPARVAAYAFFAVPYMPVAPPPDFHQLLRKQRARYGYELYGYQLFLAEPAAPAILQEHVRPRLLPTLTTLPDADARQIDSFVSLFYARDPGTWKTHLAPTGVLRANLEADWTTPLPAWLSETEKEARIEFFRRGGFPTAWYTINVDGTSAADDIRAPPISSY